MLFASLLCSLLFAGTSFAATAPKTKVAVLEVKATGAVDPRTVEGLSSLLAAEASRFPIKVVAGGDMAALLGFDRERQLLGCSESSCLAEIGGALGVDYLLKTEVSQIGGTWFVAMTLLDVARADAADRESGRSADVTQLVPLAETALRSLLSRLTGGPAPAASPAAVSSTSSEGSSLPGLLAAGVGLALVGGGVGFGVLARREADAAPDAASLAAFEAHRDAAGRNALIADCLYGAGAVGLGVGIVLLLTSGSSEPAPVTVGLSGSGASLQLRGEF